MTVQEAMAVPQLAKLRVQDFVLLAEAGAFERYARTELIEGEIWVVNAVHSQHARIHAQLTVELGLALKMFGISLVLYTAPSTELSDDSLPEPDIAIADPNHDKILHGANTRIAIEVSDTTLAMDLGRKAALYARYSVPEYWVVDVNARVIHQMWQSDGAAYAERREIPFGAAVEAATLPGLTVDTGGL